MRESTERINQRKKVRTERYGPESGRVSHTAFTRQHTRISALVFNDCASTPTFDLLYSLTKMIRQATLSLRKQGVRAFNSASLAPATLPELNYDYAALEPVISGQIMEIHHSKHHNAYVTNYNIAAEAYADAQAKNDTAAMIGLQSAIKFNGGGHVNHSIFWTNLAPQNAGGGTPPTGDLLAQIEGKWGSLNVSAVLPPC